MKLQQLKPRSKWDYIGWGVCAGLMLVMAVSGFQSQSEKLAVVDVVKVAEDSNLGKSRKVLFEKQRVNRESLIQFMDRNRVIAVDQLGRLRELSIKDSPTDADTAELNKLKADIQDKGKRFADLQTKPNLTPEEKQILADYTNQATRVENTLNRWFQEFANEMQANSRQQQQQVLDAVRAAAKQVSKAQGFTLVFDAESAPYGANDLTDATLQAINKSP